MPNLANFSPIPRVPVFGGLADLKVKDLFYSNSLEWKGDFIREICERLVRRLFSSCQCREDVKRILLVGICLRI